MPRSPPWTTRMRWFNAEETILEKISVGEVDLQAQVVVARVGGNGQDKADRQRLVRQYVSCVFIAPGQGTRCSHLEDAVIADYPLAADYAVGGGHGLAVGEVLPAVVCPALEHAGGQGRERVVLDDLLLADGQVFDEAGGLGIDREQEIARFDLDDAVFQLVDLCRWLWCLWRLG